MIRVACAVLALLLVSSALALVTSQYRARVRFAELEVAQQDGKTLESDGARLRSDRDRASQPAMVEAAARRLGMRPIAPDRIVNLPGAAPATMSATAPSVIATSATATSTTIAQERAR